LGLHLFIYYCYEYRAMIAMARHTYMYSCEAGTRSERARVSRQGVVHVNI
jgi:hypothetical protein